jgi:hypothetical protein
MVCFWLVLVQFDDDFCAGLIKEIGAQMIRGRFANPVLSLNGFHNLSVIMPDSGIRQCIPDGFVKIV